MKITLEVMNEKVGCESSHRVGRKKDGANRPIIITFDSDVTRYRLFRVTKRLKTYNITATDKIFSLMKT